MFQIMNQARNAIEAYNQALQATSSNIANMNVVGFKRTEVDFQTVFENALNRGTAAQGNLGGTNPRQFGQGMGISQVAIDFSAGDPTPGNTLSLAINDTNSLFIVSPDGGESFRYTRAGNFTIDANGYLNSNGMIVYGLSGSGALTPISGLSGSAANYRWDTNGQLFTTTGTTAITTIALTRFNNPGGLIQSEGTTFRESAASGSAFTAYSGIGRVSPSMVEKSNVFFLGESIEATEFQRAMTSNLSVISMASELISSFISKLS